MTNIVPGAIWTPIDVGDRELRKKGRGLIGHVAVSNSIDLRPGPVATRPADWTFYLPKEPQAGGRFRQYIDMDLQCWSSAGGNPTCPAFESQGGVIDPNGEPWSENQLESAAIILAYGHETEDWPLEMMPNSLPTSRGFGYHRQGIDPWRVSGGEVWSRSYGKICPGDAKIAQIPVILSRARELVGGSPTPPPPPPPPSSKMPPTFGWNLPRGFYYGNMDGPDQSIGANFSGGRYYPNQFVQYIQQWFIWLGCVPGINNWEISGWDDGKWENATDDACRRWHAKYYPHQPYPDQIWSDDLARLFQSRP